MKKMYIGLMVIAIVGLLIVSGCVQQIPKPTPTPTPTPCIWSPETSTVCKGNTFTQTSNCGRRIVDGTKDCPQPTVCNEPSTLEGYKTLGVSNFVYHKPNICDTFEGKTLCMYEGSVGGVAEFTIGSNYFYVGGTPIFIDGPDVLLDTCEDYIHIQYSNLAVDKKLKNFNIYKKGKAYIICGDNRIIVASDPYKYVELVC